MCDGPSPSQPYRPTWQDVLIALSLKPNWKSSSSQGKERTATQYYIWRITSLMSVKGGFNQHLKRRNISILTNTQKWSLTCEGKVTASDNKLVVPKRDIYRLLCEAHTATAHRGRDKTERYLYYTGISQDVVNLFVSLCKLRQEQKSVTNHCKKPILTPIKANQFLGHVEIDLIDFCNFPCECHLRHLWVLYVVDHYTKFSWLFALQRKQTEEVAGALTNLFWMFGFPSVLHSERV